MTDTKLHRRRTQDERTAATKEALIDAAIDLLHRKGYAGTSTDLIADAANVSRGALRHHFPTRAMLMAGVVDKVHQDEHRVFKDMLADPGRGRTAAEWPTMLWEVLKRPAALAVLEIVNASRSDAELANLLAPILARMDHTGLETTAMRIDPATRHLLDTDDDDGTLAAIRFFTWAIRGLSLAQVILPHAEIDRSISFFSRLAGLIDKGAAPH